MEFTEIDVSHYCKPKEPFINLYVIIQDMSDVFITPKEIDSIFVDDCYLNKTCFPLYYGEIGDIKDIDYSGISKLNIWKPFVFGKTRPQLYSVRDFLESIMGGYWNHHYELVVIESKEDLVKLEED